jgi:hypothetical protein
MKKPEKEAAKMILKERQEAVSRIQEINEIMHTLTKEKNLLSERINKIDASQK